MVINSQRLETVTSSSETSAPLLFYKLASSEGCISKAVTLNLQSRKPCKSLAFSWKCKVNKTILKKEKFDMLPSTTSLEKELSSLKEG